MPLNEECIFENAHFVGDKDETLCHESGKHKISPTIFNIIIYNNFKITQ